MNGESSILLRAIDVAGNSGDATSLTLVVDNQSPHVSLTDRWWIWESGRLEVSPNYFPIENVQVTIRNPEDRWTAVVMDFDPNKIPHSVSWDRHFADKTLAPSGEYRVLARACDTHGLCGNDTDVIIIPVVATATPTRLVSPTVTHTAIAVVTATKITSITLPTSVPTPIPGAEDHYPPSVPIWQLLGLLGLFLAISSSSVVDPRPAAMRRLGKTIQQITENRQVYSANNTSTKEN